MDNTDIDVINKKEIDSSIYVHLPIDENNLDVDNDDDDILFEKMIIHDEITVDHIKLIIDTHIDSNSFFMGENFTRKTYESILLLVSTNEM
jgi:hypothetical protein